MRKRGPYRKKLPKERFWKYVEKKGPDECWEWTGAKDKMGYGRFWDGHTMLRAHQYSFSLKEGYVPNRLKRLVVRHRCHNPGCSNPAHLEVGTPKDNSGDMVKAGRQAYGEKNGQAKLTKQQVNELRLLWETGKYTQKQLSEKYGISQPHVALIVNHKSWKNNKNGSTF